MNDQTSTPPNDWKMTTLGDVVTFSQGIQVPAESQLTEKKEHYIRFVRIVDYTNQDEIPRYIQNPGIKYYVNSDDLVMIRYGSQTAGKIVRGIEGVIANNTFKISPQASINNNYLYWYLKQPDIYRSLNKDQSSSTMPAITFTQVGSLPFNFPPLTEQKAIARVLSSLDDKIELLHEQNKTLEAIAQAIFKEWFVNFNFPGATGKMIDSELGEIPEGWRVGKYSDLVDVITGKGINKDNLKDDGKFQVLGANGEIGKTNNYLFDEDLILTGRVGTLGTIYFSKGKVWISDNVLISKPIIDRNYYFAYQTLKRIDFRSLNRGSTQPLVTQTDLKNVDVTLPTDEVLTAWNGLAVWLFGKRFRNNYQIQTLTSLRNTLLSKLMKGEVRVKGFNN